MTDANRDDKLVSIRAEFGLWGVGLYWTIVEMVAEQMKGPDPKPEAVFLLPVLCSFAECKPNKLRAFLELTRNQGGMQVSLEGKVVTVRVAKLLEIKDNYSKDLEGSGKKLPSKEGDVEVDSRSRLKRDIAKFLPPSILEVKTLWKERSYLHPESEPDRFWNFYESKGWLVGRTKMKDWKAAAAGWNSRAKEYRNGTTQQSPRPNSVTSRAAFRHDETDRDRLEGIAESVRHSRTGKERNA